MRRCGPTLWRRRLTRGAAGARENVFPTRQNLGIIKGRLKGAQTGHSLLKKKVDALQKRFRTITAKIDQAKQQMGRVMQLAAFSLAEVTYAGGDIAYMMQESVRQATFKVASKQENVSGVVLPTFEVNRVKGDSSNGKPRLQSWRKQAADAIAAAETNLTGLGRGGQQVLKSKEIFAKAVETLVELASLQVRWSPVLETTEGS